MLLSANEDFQGKLWEIQLEEEINSVDGELLLFPDGTRFVWTVGEDTCIVIEEKPQIRSIVWGDLHPTRYRLALPYVYFILNFKTRKNEQTHECQGCYLSFAKKPITSFDDLVYYPCLPDTAGDENNQPFLICMGHDFVQHRTIKAKDIINFCQETINYFWHSNFDPTHWPSNWKAQVARDNRFSIANWHNNSMSDPLFVIADETNYGKSFTFKEFFKNSTPSMNHTNNPFLKITHESVFNGVRNMSDQLWKTYLNEKFIPAMELSSEVMEAELSMIVKNASKKMFDSIQSTLNGYPSQVQEAAFHAIYEGVKGGITEVLKKRRTTKV
jgi:hypothetical protein